MSNLDFSGLDKFSDLLKDPKGKTQVASGKPLELPLACVQEDPNQPRQVFGEAAMKELADSIRARGVKTPISVRTVSDAEGQYIINHGARRYRAATVAGLETIPAFVDDDHRFVDQLVENIQREALTVPETVRAVGHMLDEGMAKGKIAKQTGKSAAWVTKYSKLQSLPERIEQAMDDGVCRDANALGILVGCYETDSAAVVAFLDTAEAITELDAKRLEARMKHEASGGEAGEGGVTINPGIDEPSNTWTPNGTEGGDLGGQGVSGGETLDDGVESGRAEFHDVKSDTDISAGEGEGGDDQKPTKPPEAAADKEKAPKNKKPQIQVKVGRREAILLPSKPCAYGLAWVQYEDGSEEEADANRVRLVAVIDAKKGGES